MVVVHFLIGHLRLLASLTMFDVVLDLFLHASPPVVFMHGVVSSFHPSVTSNGQIMELSNQLLTFVMAAAGHI